MPKPPNERVFRNGVIAKLNEVALLAAVALLIDCDALRSDPSQIPFAYRDALASLTPDEWEELQALLKVNVGSLRNSLRRHHPYLLQPDHPRGDVVDGARRASFA